MPRKIKVKQYVTNCEGEKTGVILDIREYRRLQETLEDYEDALDLKRAIKTAKKFVDYHQVRERLVSRGKLCRLAQECLKLDPRFEQAMAEDIIDLEKAKAEPEETVEIADFWAKVEEGRSGPLP